jgi:hydrogenase nickel incorporation protein HypA/HybF
MHEMGLAEGILSVVVSVADGQPVERVRVRVGTLQRIAPDSLRFCFQLASQDTCAADAFLDVKQIEARVRCRQCRVESGVESTAFACASCGTFDVELVAGTEASVEAVKLPSGWRRRPQTRHAAALDT